MSRLRSNCSVTRVEPCELLDVISVTPAMLPSERSSGVATLEAMVSGLAPGRLADTEMVGMSTCGSGATGSRKNDSSPPATARVSSVVATGRTMKGAEMIMKRPGPRRPRAAPATRQTVEHQVNDRRGEQRQHLAQQQPADHHQAQRLAQLSARAGGQHQR